MSALPSRGVRAGRVRRAWRAVRAGDVDLTVPVGSLELANPVMTASGTAGHADELGAYFPLGDLGAVVVKSLSVGPWAGNPPPRVHQTPSGMLNSVGLQGPGLEAWIASDLPRLTAAGARTVVSIWGQRVEDFAKAASMLTGVAGIAAVEVNVSSNGHKLTAEVYRKSGSPRLIRKLKGTESGDCLLTFSLSGAMAGSAEDPRERGIIVSAITVEYGR